jgi:23S rRNA (uracil1939-C5)-methyltransferase
MEGVELVPTAVAAGGDAIGRLPDGRVVFVEGALPGEVVRVEPIEERRDFARARVVEVVSASPDRVEPPCPAFARGCGGCPWQWIAVPAQRRLKRDIVVDALRRIAHLPDPPVEEVVAGVADRGYRTTVRVGVTGGRAAYRRRRSHELVPVEDGCLVAHPSVEQMLRRAVFSETDGRDVVVRAFDREQVAGRTWRVSAGSFFQSGPEAAELLVEAVGATAGDALDEGGVLVDAYAGIGLLGGSLAAGRRGVRLVAVESSGAATRDARRNLADLDAEVVRCDVGRWDGSRVAPAALVVADPPRSGLGRRGVRALVAAEAPVFVLVACDPAAFARDVVLLQEAGFRLESVQVLDLYPHTVHVEAVARLVRL